MDARAIDIGKKRQRAGRLGGQRRSEKKTTAVRLNAAKGGSVSSERKATAARANGRLGGRPTNAIREARELVAIFGPEPTHVSATPD
jgi:hypothetical protein